MGTRTCSYTINRLPYDSAMSSLAFLLAKFQTIIPPCRKRDADGPVCEQDINCGSWGDSVCPINGV